MTPPSDTRSNRLAAVGLALGAIFGLAGSFVGDDALRHVFWTIDGAGIIVAAALMAVRYARAGDDWLAASFSVFLAGEVLVLSGASESLEAARASFGSGITLWAIALLMTSRTAAFPRWSRVTGIVAAGLFLTTAVMIATSDPILATSEPLPSAGYPFLVLTFVGWIRALLAPLPSAAPSTADPVGGAATSAV